MTAFDTNLLEDALDVVGRQNIQYFPYISRTKNEIGLLVSERGIGRTAEGSIQPIPRQLYESMGLNLQKYYVTIFISKNVIDIARDVAGDQFSYGGRRFQAESRTDWYGQDGWDAIVCVEVPNA